MNHPVRNLLVVYLIAVGLVLIALIPVKQVSIGRWAFKLPQIEDFLREDTVFTIHKIADIQLIADSLEEVVMLQPSIDSSDRRSEATPKKSTQNHRVAGRKTVIQPLEFGESGLDCLGGFFESLLALELNHTTFVHVAHYGDSQIEGDRITSYLRGKLQQQFGGMGPGLLPLANQALVPFVGHRCSAGWSRINAHNNPHDSLAKNVFGPLADISLYASDTSVTETANSRQWVSYDASRAIYRLSRSFATVRVFYGATENPVRIWFPFGDTTLEETLPGKNEINLMRVQYNEPKTALRLEFWGEPSPHFYGVSLTGNSGICVSNIALRGSSGTFFSKLNKQALKGTLDELNTTLVVMQFGGNVMPYIETEDELNRYARWIGIQVKYMKSLFPQTSLIFIGPADMAIKQDLDFETYPLLPTLRDALREQVTANGAAFWDMYSAMGGRNSIVQWVEADPPLAVADYTHFTHRGARVIAEWFYIALMDAYQDYKDLKLTQYTATHD
ncbi:MAG: hypothetical protein Kow0075_14950 [Salibacteraceae bacterium]